MIPKIIVKCEEHKLIEDNKTSIRLKNRMRMRLKKHKKENYEQQLFD